MFESDYICNVKIIKIVVFTDITALITCVIKIVVFTDITALITCAMKLANRALFSCSTCVELCLYF
jgi:hypothetical protein